MSTEPARKLYKDYRRLVNRVPDEPDNEELLQEIVDFTDNLERNGTPANTIAELRRLISNPPEDEGAGVASPPIGGRKSRKAKSRKTLKKKRSTRRKHLKKF